MKNENYDDNENSMTAEEFLDFMRKNRRTVPNEKRIANKDKFSLFTTMRKQESLKTPAKCNLA